MKRVHVRLNSTLQAALLRTFEQVLRPLIRICFRRGIAMVDVRHALDRAAICEAEAYLRSIDEKPAHTRIAAITGIQRRHVAAMRSAIPVAENGPTMPALEQTAMVLTGWREDDQFKADSGTPAQLPVRGPSPSFEALAQKFAPGVPAAYVLDHLLETGAVELIEPTTSQAVQCVRPRQGVFRVEVDDAQVVSDFGTVYADAMDMLDRALSATGSEALRPYTVTSTVLAPKLRLLRRLLAERGEAIQSTIGETLEEHNLSQAEIDEVLEVDPSSLYSIRVTMFSTIRPAFAEHVTRAKAKGVAGPRKQ